MFRSRRRKILIVWSIVIFTIAVVLFKNRKRGDGGFLDGLLFPISNRPSKVDTARGFLNVAIWEDICGYEMLSLKQFPLFPHGPSARLRTSTLHLQFRKEFESFGLRIFGFLSPRESGSYHFHLFSSGSSELWMSFDSKPENSKLIANESTIPLSKGKRYYMEIVHKHGYVSCPKKNRLCFQLKSKNGRGDDEEKHYMHLQWRSSTWKDHNLRDIPSDVLSPFEDDQYSNRFRNLSNRIPSKVSPIHQVYHDNNIALDPHRDPSFINENVKRRAEMYRLPFINEEDTRDLFTPCQYNPSYIMKKPLKRYQATWENHYNSIYPFDYTDIIDERGGNFLSFGNDQMDENTAKEIVSQVWTQIQSKHPGKYSLQHTLNVEENHDQGTGDRYLVELELKETSNGKSVRFSEYVYRPWGTHALCTPVGVTWNKNAVINILLTTGNNQGRWLLHFFHLMSKIHKRTKDFNFNVVITEFDGIDIDLKEALKMSELPHYQHVRLQGKFQKAYGLQLAANMVTDPNSILFVMDLQLDIPYHFLDDVRKHCVQHKVAYSPLLTRLLCGATAHQLSGYWEVHGYGLMAMYKSDWDRIGGMNVEEFKNKWGGEDWEICDRILMDGMEIERLKMLHLFHYFHSKKGMWADVHNATELENSDEYWL